MSKKDDFSSILSELELNEYIALDLETTGLNSKTDSITEIAACRFIDGKIKDKFSTLINPEISIPSNITDITGISNEMVKNAPVLKDVLHGFMDFIGSTPIVGQNIDFDYDFIKTACKKYNISFDITTLYDTLPLARMFIYFHNSFNLSSLCEYYNISNENAHRAESDALSTGLLFLSLIKEAISKPLDLIEKINFIIKNTKSLNNNKLFSNLLKMLIRRNMPNGIRLYSSALQLTDNIFMNGHANNTSNLPNSPLDWFSDDGVVKMKWPSYENRISQRNLIKDIHSAFNNEHILIAEAGTGLGKSLAYLSSGFFISKQKNIPLVISTQTKNLQEQLFCNDIPQLSKVLEMNLKTIIYKGKHNYVCKTRLDNLIENHSNLLNSHEYEALMAILVWEHETISGDINECNGFQLDRFNRLWSIVCSDKGYCSFNKCKKYDGCYLGKIRNEISDTDIIIVNHSLFANELQNENSFLPDDFIYVIDEAHHFSKIMREQLGKKFTLNSFDSVFQYFKDSKKHSKSFKIKGHSEIFKVYGDLSIKCNDIKNYLSDFFNSYYNIRKNDLNDSGYLVEKHRYKNPHDEFIDSTPAPWELLNEIEIFEKELNDYCKIIIDKRQEISRSILIEIEILMSSCKKGIEDFKAILSSENDIVKWATFVNRDSNPHVIFNAFPLNVNNVINEILLDRHKSGLFCSATLTVNDEFTFFEKQMGIDLLDFSHEVKKEIYPSPFYYSDQVKLFVYDSSIDINTPLFMSDVAEQINMISKTLKRRMLVLCTAFKQTLALRTILKPMVGENCKLIVQKPGSSRNVMVKEYLEHSNAILIGTSSFWEGVDFPGDKVEILCIIKTPFSNPFDPIIKSQIEDYEQYGENAFLNFQVPEAIMKLRQGFGRLIRNMNDTGICIIMDTRLSRRKYGKMILNSLPVDSISYQKISTLIADSQKFF